MRRAAYTTLLLILLLGTQQLSSIWVWGQATPENGDSITPNEYQSDLILSESANPGSRAEIQIGAALASADSENEGISPINDTSKRLLIGIYKPGIPRYMTRLRTFEELVKANMDIVCWFQQWGNPNNKVLRLTDLEKVDSHGATPCITWEPTDGSQKITQPKYKLTNIIEGKFDNYIRNWAKKMKIFGRPVLLRFAHEMNHPHFPWSVGVSGNTPFQYVRAWRHVHDIFVQEGATNVLWMWAPNIEYAGTTPFNRIYPGDDYVDWIGLTGFNGGTALPWGGWLTFRQIFWSSYRKLTNLYQKPIIIAEVASVDQGGNKAHWIRNMFSTTLITKYPRIKGIIWYDTIITDSMARIRVDWRVNSSQASLRAFRNAVKDTLYYADLKD